jgi:transposase-like protein
MSYVHDRQGESIMTYSMDYRRAVAAAYDEVGSSAEVAGQFGCTESWVRRLIQRRRKPRSIAAQPPQVAENALFLPCQAGNEGQASS